MKVWFLSFESRNIAKFGGLAEVPPSLAKELRKKGIESLVITPSHGKMPGSKAEKIYETTYGGRKISLYLFNELDPPHIVVAGHELDDPIIYGDKLYDKIKLFTIGVYKYAEYILKNGFLYPDIIHGNDWHVVPLMIKLKTLYNNNNVYPAFIYHIHLLSRRYIAWNELLEFGLLGDEDIVYYHNGNILLDKIINVYNSSTGLIDRLASIVSDALVTVSKHYLVDVLSNIGWDLKDKSHVVYNATTWSYEDIVKKISHIHQSLKSILSNNGLSNRRLIREYVETKAIENLHNEPIILDPYVENYLCRHAIYPFKECGKQYPFNSPGPLVIMSGRLTKQKGYDLLLKALEEVIDKVSNVRFVLFPIPSGDNALFEEVVKYTIIYNDYIRVFFGRTPSLYKLAHLAADVYVAPSIYEPFGIMVLEAMSLGTPVVASKTGGLSETILDIRIYGEKGTGLHIKPGYVSELAKAVSDLTLFMDSVNYKPYSSEWNELVNRISDQDLIKLLMKNPLAPIEVRKSCISRAREFSWSKSADQAIRVYKQALRIVSLYSANKGLSLHI